MCVEGPILEPSKTKEKIGFLFFLEAIKRDGHISSDHLLETSASATRL